MSLSKQPALTALLIVAVVTAVVYSNSLSNAFTFYDHPVVEKNAILRGSLQEILTSPFWPGQPELGLYRPVTLLSFAANLRVLGEEPSGYRVVNVALHALACWFLYLIVSRLCGHRAALVSSIVFVVHPVQSEAVNAIVGRAEILAGLFGLLAWYASQRAGSEGARWRVLSLLAYFLACFSKEHAFVLPSFLIAEDILLNQEGRIRERLSGSLSRWRIWIPYLAVGLGVLAIRASTIGTLALPRLPDFIDNPLAHTESISRVLSGVSVFGRYMALLLAPVQLSVDYTFDQIPVVTSFLDGYFALGFLVLATTLTLAYQAANDEVNALIGLGGILIVLAWFPISNVPFPIATPMNERLFYLPMIGFGVLVGVGYGRLEEVSRGCPPWIVGAIVCVLFAVRTSVRNADWRDDLTLFSAAAHASPSSAKAAFNLGNAFRDEGNDTAALDGYDRALAIYPEYVEVYYNQGVLYQRQKNHGLALAAYRKATDYDPDHVNALANIGILLARSGNADGAIIQLERAIAVSPDRGDIYYNLGLVLERKDRRGAIAAYQEALRVVPGYEDAAVNLAMIYRQQGREVEVRSLYRDVLGANPQAYRVAYNLAAELERAGEVDDAIDAYRVAWSAGGEVGAFSRLRMGSLFAKSGKSDSARLSLLEFKADWKGDPRHGETADRLLEHLK